MSSKKLIIVGAGVSGLSAGIYAARSGFDVTILEQHNTFGGFSTGWSRKGYFFEGGMHWLTGSAPDLPLNRLWRETGALASNNPIENRDPLYTVYDGKEQVSLYRYLPQMQAELLRYAPEDSKMIKKMCRDTKAFANFHMPVFDVAGCKCKNPVGFIPLEFIKMLPAVVRVLPLKKESLEHYLSKFKNKNLRHLLNCVIGYRYNALSFIYTLGAFAAGDCGYPDGGSIRLVKNMEETYKNLGGKIEYRAKVEKVLTENGKVKGLQSSKGDFDADAVIITQDTRAAIDQLFEKPLDEKWTYKMRKNLLTDQNIFISLGVKADLSALPYAIVLPLKKPLEYGGCKWTEIRLNNYARYKDHSPQGSTSLTSLLIGDTYGFWKTAKADGTYKAKKEELCKMFVEAIGDFIPEVKNQLEVTDVATPLTYERYTGAFEGSWMSVYKPGGSQDNYPLASKSVKGLYFAGLRTMMPGGLPIAVYTGRQAVQQLCRDNGAVFD